VGNLAAGFRAYAADGSGIVFTAGGNFGSDQDGADDLFARAGGVTTPLTAGTGSSFIAFNAASANATGIVYTTLDSVLPQDGDGEADIYKNLNGVTTLESYELVAPITTITSGPTGLTKLNPPPFGWTASETNVEFNCRYDGAQFGACGSLAKLSQGPHTFQVRATDRAGNVGPAASRSFTVDSVAPAVTIKPAPRPAFNGVFKITVTCPKSAAGRCRGRLVITSGKRIKVGKTRRVVTFASKSFSIKAGARTTLKLRVSKRNLAILKRLRSVRAVMTATVTDGLGNKRTTRKTLTLRAPKANR
jgi:hypothetical protein